MSSAKRVAVNSVVQYINLIINVVFGLYSVRLILGALGEVDYGIYGIVGGVISMLAFLNTSLAQTSVRYLSVCLGKKDIVGLRNTFNDCFWLHLFLAFALAVLFELLFPFLFNGLLKIPSERIDAAKWVYHCMVFVLFLKISTTPFSALVVSHEKFVYVSLLGIANTCAKLFVAYALWIVNHDKLITYAVLMAVVTSVDVLLYLVFLIVKYKGEVRISRPYFEGMKRLTGFAGWTIVDTVGNVVSRQGYPIVLNHFFGAAINAAYEIGRQVAGHVYVVSSTCVETIKPQIIKSYGVNDTDRMLKLSLTAGKIGFIMMSFVTIPLFIMMPYILDLWLVQVPKGAITFARMLMVVEMVEQLTKGITYACQAMGRIRGISILVAGFRILGIVLSAVAFLFIHQPIIALYFFIVCESLASFSRVIVLSKISQFRIRMFIKQILIGILPSFFIAFTTCYLVYMLKDGLLWVLFSIMVTVIVYSLMTYLIGLTDDEKQSINSIVKSFAGKLRRR